MSEFPIPRDGYLAFDAYTLKQHIKNALNKSGNFTDQNYEGSYISTIIDIVSYMFHVLMFYLNKTSTESMFSEAQIYENINRIVKMLDYKPIGMSTSILSFGIKASSSLERGTYIIPRYSHINARGIPYTLNKDLVFIKKTQTDEDLEEVSNNVLLYQGVWREYSQYTAKGEQNEIVYLTPGKNVKIDHNNIDVYVKKAATGKWDKWRRTISLYLENNCNEVYEVRYNENKQYEIKFGNDVNGEKLKEGDVVAIYYLESRGDAGEVGVGAINNQPLKFFMTPNLQHILIDVNRKNPIQYIEEDNVSNLSFYNTFISTYASPEESVENIRSNAPATFRSQFRLVTREDYETFIRVNFSNMIHDIKIFNNWSYVSDYLKYFYDLGIKNPFNASRPLYNQVNFADACNFNNVYVFAVPKTSTRSSHGISYLSPASKNKIISLTNDLKTLTSETIILDPVYTSFALCAPGISKEVSLQDAENSTLNVIKSPTSRRDDNSVKRDIINIITDYFDRNNNKLGQHVNISQMTADILNVPGVEKITTINTDTGDSFDGISMMYWDPMYPPLTPKIAFNNIKLNDFMFPVLNDKDLVSKINVLPRRIYETVEY